MVGRRFVSFECSFYVHPGRVKVLEEEEEEEKRTRSAFKNGSFWPQKRDQEQWQGGDTRG